MNYYISGRSGFIGMAISEYLLDMGESVFTIQRGATKDQLISSFEGNNPDYIIHLASYGNHYFQKDFLEMVNANIISTYNILESSKSFDYKIFYNISTSSVALKKQTCYSITKYCGKQLAEMYNNVVNVTPYSVYGPGEAEHGLIPTVIRCLDSGSQMVLDEDATHSWVFVDDFIKAMFAGETEIGSGTKLTNKEIVLILEDISGKKLNYVSGKLRDYDNDDWPTPRGVCYTDIYEGLKLTYKYFKR